MRVLFELYEGLRIAGQAIWANKLRSVLTTLGIIIGIIAVTLMATVIDGLDQQFEKSLSQLGTDVVYVSKWPWGQNTNLDWWNYVNRPAIESRLAESIRERSRYARAVAPMTSTNRTVQFKERSIGAEVTGSTPEYGRIRNVELESGRFFTEADERGARNVCVIGATVAEELFPIATPLGKRIRLGNKPCSVIGVQEKQGKGLFGSVSSDESVIMPFSTFEKLFGMSRWRSINVMIQLPQGPAMEQGKDEITGIVRIARGVEPTEENNFEINDSARIRQSFSATKIAINSVGLFLTSLALVVGGIGVSNIMFVSVRERTKEIGVRKAVGAKRRTIMLQFLVEAIIVCMIGGLIGVAISIGLTPLIEAVMGVTAVLPLDTILIAFGICVFVGIVAGIAPAWQAATADPIEALRYE
ncbi:ABC transporter ATP-binding protein [Longibacter salinarum]|uniref:ABC transporter ATP-binding protein n=1 Tax=Longibacter salinarum TaxID=1850348 RepID=A0A2A8CWT9_9BACT|nr:ABC transporter permease [Longibacter salinarum]PEN13081.1 ABC transporter ATP-binding protein [Longibacter salinarum]